MSTPLRYALVTPAHNEETFIEQTIQSMIAQTVPPVKWVIVDDGSTDGTADIIKRYLDRCPWMELVQRPKRRERDFGGKVAAFNVGQERLQGLQFDVIGNLDADISFEPDYLEFLLGKFAADSSLGVAGTIFKEEGYSSGTDSFEGSRHVAGACQMFRTECWSDIGGYTPNRAGGIDWIAVTMARMKGWKTESFREKWCYHHRHLGTAERGILASMFSYGEKDYYLGGHPLWEFFRIGYRCIKRPYLFGGVALGLGYCWAFLCRTPRPVSKELMAFHRKEQMAKLAVIFQSLLRFKSVDNFSLERN